jgi:hypothetical protein
LDFALKNTFAPLYSIEKGNLFKYYHEYMTTPTGPTDPSQVSNQADQAQGAHHKKAPAEFGSVTGKPMDYLGMHFTGPEAAKLWDIIMQQLNTQVRHEQERMLKALRKLRKSETGQE